jgi:pimeloyl-ACP methyl ester carboxylesterase
MTPWSAFASLAFLVWVGIGRAESLVPEAAAIACDDIPAPTVPGAEVLSIATDLLEFQRGSSINDYTVNAALSICTVNVTLTHPGANDKVEVWVWLPVSGWNGRFQGIGGGGWQAGNSGLLSLGPPVLQGYVAAATDGSKIYNGTGLDPALVLEPGKLDLARVADFAHRGLHEVAVVGKAVTASFYGTSSFYSYWNGCSQGGRQGFQLAQRYPDDFDGILANAPAIFWPNMTMSLNWARQSLKILKYTPSLCVLNAIKKAAVDKCDLLDGVRDGVVSNPTSCQFDPFTIVGRDVSCGLSGSKKIGLKDALLTTMIHNGPVAADGKTKLWDGYEWGTDITLMLPAALSGIPPSIEQLTDDWFRFFLKRDPNYDLSQITTLKQWVDLVTQGDEQWGEYLGTSNPDLSAFKSAGGKLISWHGSSDGLLPTATSIRYRRQVEAAMGGADRVSEFYKLFIVPGVGHCGGGNGATPQNVLKKLEDWVEKGVSPTTLQGTTKDLLGATAERIICTYPLVARYNKTGDPNKASSYTCATSFS